MSEIKEMTNKVKAFNKERGWNEKYNPKNMSMDIAIESTELMEIFQWMSDSDSVKAIKDSKVHEKIKEELGDVVWTTLVFADIVGIDIKDALEEKLKLTAKRYPVGKFKPGQKYTEDPNE